MKTTIAKTIALTFISICVSLSARCQTNSNGLAIIATDASLVTNTNAPSLFLTLCVLNTTNHDLVVFTKGLDSDLTESDTNKWICNIGMDDNSSVTCQGHTIIPSFYDFSPVTIRPNEVASVWQSFDLTMSDVKTNSQITVHYSISPDWARRFVTWAGSVTSKPFNVSGSELSR
jgi:hypothetical protein